MRKIKAFCLFLLILLLGLSTVGYAYGTNRNSIQELYDMTPEASVAFLEERGVTIPGTTEERNQWAEFAQMTIRQVIDEPGIQFTYSFTVSYDFANAIKQCVLSLLPTSYTGSTPIRYSLQDSVIIDTWQDRYAYFNCYGYALGRESDNHNPGYYSGTSYTSVPLIATLASYTSQDLRALGKNCVHISTTDPHATLAAGRSLICIRKAPNDYHFMKWNGSNWVHKPGTASVPLRWRYSDPSYKIWTNEYYGNDDVAHEPYVYYSGPIEYIDYAANHTWEYVSSADQYRCKYCGCYSGE